MACDSWKAKLDTYLDGEFPSQEMRALDAHIHNCPSCAADALVRLQMKRSVQAAGRRFAPSSDLRRRVQQSIATKPLRGWSFRWMPAVALSLVVVAGLVAYLGMQRARQDQVYGEIADLHVAALASSSQVDVVSTDRHTVKPWFQGKIPFTFDLPDLQNSEFSLLGGRMTYLEQTPGAHLIYQIRKHEISVFIFQDEAIRGKWDGLSHLRREHSFNMETWSQGGLQYYVVGDASATDIDNLAKLLKTAGSR